MFIPGQPYKGSMTTTGENDELLAGKAHASMHQLLQGV